jgi:cell division protein FtsL
MGRNLLLLMILVLCGLSVVTSRHVAHKTFVEMERQRMEIYQYEVEHNRLRLEQQTYATQQRIDRLAREKLNMQFPTPEQIRVVAYRPPNKASPPKADIE